MSLFFPHLMQRLQIRQLRSCSIHPILAIPPEHPSASRDTSILEARRLVQQHNSVLLLHRKRTSAAPRAPVEYRWLTSDQCKVQVFLHQKFQNIKNVTHQKPTELGTYPQKIAKRLGNLVLMKSPSAERTSSQAPISNSFLRCAVNSRDIFTMKRLQSSDMTI